MAPVIASPPPTGCSTPIIPTPPPFIFQADRPGEGETFTISPCSEADIPEAVECFSLAFKDDPNFIAMRGKARWDELLEADVESMKREWKKKGRRHFKCVHIGTGYGYTHFTVRDDFPSQSRAG
jgi:hypothetical protein